MNDNGKAFPQVDEARGRLDAALKNLSDLVGDASDSIAADTEIQALRQQVDTLTRERDALGEQVKAAKAGLADKNDLKARVAKLETENLGLHEQIAAHALSGPEGDAELRAALASARAEKKMLEERYAALKSSYAELEKQAASTDTMGTDATALAALEEKLKAFEAEREDIRQTLDLGITRIEGVLQAGGAAHG